MRGDDVISTSCDPDPRSRRAAEKAEVGKDMWPLSHCGMYCPHGSRQHPGCPGNQGTHRRPSHSQVCLPLICYWRLMILISL